MGAVSNLKPYPLAVKVGELVAVPGLKDSGPGVDTLIEPGPNRSYRMETQIVASGLTAEATAQQDGRSVESTCRQHN